MIISIGSINKAKILAVKEIFQESNFLSLKKLISLNVNSGVSNQPLSLYETILGAKNRAKNAFEECCCKYSFGLESGLMESVGTSTGYLHITVCCIYDGRHYYTGTSMGFEIPKNILNLVLKKMDLAQACLHSGISNNTNIGSTEGLIGILTKGKFDRKKYSKQAILAAILQLENQELYIPDPKNIQNKN